jgi:hypothetical protein
MLAGRIGALCSFSLAHLACFPSLSETVVENQQECLLLGKGKDLMNFEATALYEVYFKRFPNDAYSLQLHRMKQLCVQLGYKIC